MSIPIADMGVRLHSALQAVAPGASARCVRESPPLFQAITLDTHTPTQKSNADSLAASFDTSQSAHQTFLDNTEQDLVAILTQAPQAVADINTFLAITNPTNAQIVAEVKAIDQRQRAVIKSVARLAALVRQIMRS